ncbi:hypothetical protein [Paenibacillus shenyangensis]|uniref:hypothetical protein n=1 Tax=Paenibacillus sp. A9 TaxID=1284352 RepID=UPI001267AE06|nr:hypothetical protein [Paenibacillus sp. A9]
MRRSPTQLIIFVVMILLAVIGLASSIYRMIFMPATFNWGGLIVTVVILAIAFMLLRSSRTTVGMSKQPKIKPSARTMAKLKSQQSQYKTSSKSAPFAKSTPSPSGKPKKNYPFQVIQGNKGKDDEDVPKFH